MFYWESAHPSVTGRDTDGVVWILVVGRRNECNVGICRSKTDDWELGSQIYLNCSAGRLLTL